jgi:toxin FitB
MRARPSPQVITRVAKQLAEELFTTSITEAEIFYGIQLLATGTNGRNYLAAAEAMFAEDLSGRILGFDTDATRAFAKIAAERRSLGTPISHADAQIAAITQIRKATLATRNVSDFENCRIEVVDPW